MYSITDREFFMSKFMLAIFPYGSMYLNTGFKIFTFLTSMVAPILSEVLHEMIVKTSKKAYLTIKEVFLSVIWMPDGELVKYPKYATGRARAYKTASLNTDK